MTTYPVHYHVEAPGRFTRLELLARLIAFIALGVIGVSFGTVFLVAYLALPVFAAGRLAARDELGDYGDQDGPRVVKVLHWFAAFCAWASLTAEHLPVKSPSETVTLELESVTHPTPPSALWRVVTGLPSALVLGVLCFLGSFVWLWAALTVLFTQRVGPGAFHYLEGLQRWSVRLLAYQASLVDEYPPFSFSDLPPGLPPGLPSARAAH
jgi:hypothetical protein